MRNYLLKKNLTVKEFASRLGISTSYLYQLVRGERKPSLELAYRIEQCTNKEIKVKDLLRLDIQCIESEENRDRQLIDLQANNQKLKNRMEHLENRVSRLESRFYHKGNSEVSQLAGIE